MKNETFREIGYWGSVVSAVLGLINIIVCFIKGIKIFNTTLQGDIMDLIIYPAETSFTTVLYKISLGVLFIALLMMFISFLVNADGILKIIMVLCKVIQMACIGGGLVGYFKLQSISFIKMSMICFAVIELIAIILYLIDSDHRKTILRVVVFSILTAGCGFIYFVFAMLLIFFLCIMIAKLIYAIFKEPEHKTAVIDTSGKVIGWLKRE
jgi:hypothetical protein